MVRRTTAGGQDEHQGQITESIIPKTNTYSRSAAYWRKAIFSNKNVQPFTETAQDAGDVRAVRDV